WSATSAAVRVSRLPSSGCWWMSRRHSTTLACSVRAASTTSARCASCAAAGSDRHAASIGTSRAGMGRGWRIASLRVGMSVDATGSVPLHPVELPLSRVVCAHAWIAMYEIAVQVLAWLFLAALLAGFIDAIAGGGGMVTIPAMLLAGIPPLQVLGTNKLQAVFGSGAASWSYARGGHVDLRGQWPMVLSAGLGAAGGA